MFFVLFQTMHLNRMSTLTATLAVINLCTCANILMITMGGTKSHKIPFWELARGLIPRGHNITFINAFPADFDLQGLEEITPAGLVFYVRNFTNWDLVGARMRGEDPVPPLDMIRYASEVSNNKCLSSFSLSFTWPYPSNTNFNSSICFFSLKLNSMPVLSIVT